MSNTPAPVNAAKAADPKQTAYDALNQLLNTSSDAANNPANTPAAQDAAFAVRTATSTQLAALDLVVFTGNTVQLQASEDSLTPGLNQLKALQARINALAKDLKEAESILQQMDGVAKAFEGLV